MITELQLALEKELHAKNIPFTVTKGKTHPSLNFELDGKKERFTFPGTPSDNRAYENAVHDLRRMLPATEHHQTIRASKFKQAKGIFRLRIAFTREQMETLEGYRIEVERIDNIVMLRPNTFKGYKIQKIRNSKKITGYILISPSKLNICQNIKPVTHFPLIKKNNNRLTFKLPNSWISDTVTIQPATPTPTPTIQPATNDTILTALLTTLNNILKQNKEYKVQLSEEPHYHVHIHKVVKIG